MFTKLMLEMLTKVRVWLSTNKIFFEVANLIVFAFVTVVLSYRAYDLQKRSAQVEIIEKLPDIRISASAISMSDESLSIENVGDRLDEARFDISSYVEYSVGGKMHIRPVIYYVVCTQFAKPIGLLQKCVQTGNRSEFFRLYTDVVKSLQSGKITDADIVLRTYVRAHYRDIFGETHERCLVGDTMGAYGEDINCSGATKEENLTKAMLPIDIEKVNLSDLEHL